MTDVFEFKPLIAGITIIGWSGFGIFVRFVSRNDKHRTWVLSDFSIGVEIMIALLTLITSRVVDYLVDMKKAGLDMVMELNLDNDINRSVYGLMILFITIWMISTLIRKKGWDADGEPNLTWGIMIPNIFSIYIMFYFFNLFNFLFV